MYWFIFCFGILNFVCGVTNEIEWLKALNYVIAGFDFGYLLGYLCYKNRT